MVRRNRNALHVDPSLKAQNNSMMAERIMTVLPLCPGSTVLEVGCGGAELSRALSEGYGLDCFGLEPYPQYQPRIDASKVIQGVAESIPFIDDSFDLVIAKDVLEHVDDVHASVNEMLRVSRRYVYIVGPNYLYPYEAHFKVPFPPMLPKTLARLYLRMFGFETEQIRFLEHINYVTKPWLLRTIWKGELGRKVWAVIDLQLAKRFRRNHVLAPLLDLFRNYKIELLVIKGGTDQSLGNL